MTSHVPTAVDRELLIDDDRELRSRLDRDW